MSKQQVVFDLNKPVEVALAFGEGKNCPSRFGPDRVMYSLCQPVEHVMFLDAEVARKVHMLEPAVGERFSICKRNSKKWDLWLSPGAEKARAAAEAGIPLTDNGRPAWGTDRKAEREARDREAIAKLPSMLERDLAASVAEAEKKTRKAAASEMPTINAAAVLHLNTHNSSKLADALKAAVGAAHAAGEYAKSIGYAAMPQFTAEDLAKMAMTVLIGENGGRR